MSEAKKNYLRLKSTLDDFIPNLLMFCDNYIEELEERIEILTRELKIIYESHGKTYYEIDRIKFLIKSGEDNESKE